MWYLWGLILDTPLWGCISFGLLLISGMDLQKIIYEATTLNNTFFLFSIHSLVFCPLFLFLHVVFCRLRKSHTSAAELVINALISGLTAPFRKIWIFLLVITRKHIIQDDSTWHNVEDFSQVVLGFIWAILLAVFLASGFLSH
jgi:hypothetical protein